MGVWRSGNEIIFLTLNSPYGLSEATYRQWFASLPLGGGRPRETNNNKERRSHEKHQN
jgi:hypothetical protein